MADFTPVALGIKAPEGMSLGDMANIARSAQMYRQAEQTNPLALEQAQETTKQSKLKTETDQMALLQKRFKHIADSQISMINNPLIVAAERNPEAVDKAKLAEVVKRNGMTTAKALGIAPDQAEELLAPYVELASTNPAGLRQYYKERHIQGLDEGSRTSALGASGVGVNTGAGGYTVQTGEFGPQPAGAVVPGTAYNAQVAPSSQETLETDPLTGNKVVVTKDPSGKIISSRAAPASSIAGGFNPINAGESTATIEAMQAERAQAKQSATAAASALTNIETIRKYLPLAQTGKYSEAVAGLQSAFGNLAGSTAEEKAASARDIIQKNIADLGLQKNAALGNKFAADLSAVQQSIADAGKNPTAIMKSMEQLQPLIQHAQLYQQGLEKAIEKSGGNIQVKRKYDNEMVTAFDPKALMAYNAYKAGDKKALSSLSTKEKEDLFAKIERYARLVNGDL